MHFQIGDVYDVGGSLALYWPDTHPSGPADENAGMPWLVLHPWGDTERAAELRLREDGTEPDRITNITGGRHTSNG